MTSALAMSPSTNSRVVKPDETAARHPADASGHFQRANFSQQGRPVEAGPVDELIEAVRLTDGHLSL